MKAAEMAGDCGFGERSGESAQARKESAPQQKDDSAEH